MSEWWYRRYSMNNRDYRTTPFRFACCCGSMRIVDVDGDDHDHDEDECVCVRVCEWHIHVSYVHRLNHFIYAGLWLWRWDVPYLMCASRSLLHYVPNGFDVCNKNRLIHY